MTLYLHYYIVTILFHLFFALNARSIYRINKSPIPMISIYNNEKKLCTTISDSHLEIYPQFTFTIDALKKYTIPNLISYANNKSRLVSKKRIDYLIETFIKELNNGKRDNFAHFTVLKSKNFNFHYNCGLLVLKCKNHPFIVKLFIEHPETYFDYNCKGIESTGFFFMGGGANRHISGMSRLLNIDLIKRKLDHSKQWKKIIKFPRKWLWLPKDSHFMYLIGKNLGNKKIIANKIPEIFAIIADEINCNETLEISLTEKQKIIFEICNEFSSIDAHYVNFIFKKKDDQSFTVTIIDTEHFPTMVGFKKKQSFNNYWEWYIHLSMHCMKKMLFRTKKDRLYAQTQKNELALI